MNTVYIETSIVSYLRDRPSGQLVTATRQLMTKQWWDEEKAHYELVTSQFAIDEASLGHPKLAAERLESLKSLPLLPQTPEIIEIANEIISQAALPTKARLDALHIASAAHHEVQYLLTWNFKHIANANLFPKIQEVLLGAGTSIPIICTPEELLGNG